MKQSSNKSAKGGAKNGEPAAGTPIFLRKTYDMINTCDDAIASWYDDGKTFVVKDTEKFATDVIPAYFKHNNFSSFVRQLNFYGFRKIKSGSLRIAEAATSEESRYWKFRHEKFQRGRPDLLTQIRKNTTETADKQEVDQLRGEVRDLRSALMKVNDDVTKLKALVEILVKNQEVSVPSMNFSDIPTSKKRKIASSDYLAPAPISTPSILTEIVVPEAIAPLSSDVPMAVPSDASLIPLPVPSSDDSIAVGSTTFGDSWPDMSNIKPAKSLSRRATSTSTSISSTLDDEMLIQSLLNMDEDDDDVPYFDDLDSVVTTTL